MLNWATSEFVAAVSYLLPGFLAAWIFYGLTAHPRREPFERIVQALIFTGIIQAMNFVLRWFLELASVVITFGAWTQDVAVFWSVIHAVLIGLVFSVLANYDLLHKKLRDLEWIHPKLKGKGVTKRTSFPSEWFSAFNKDKRRVVLHLEGERRLYGWPEEWPDSAECGHFVICDASWILDNNELVPIYAAEQLVIPVSTVKMVERVKTEDEMTVSDELVVSAEKQITSLYQKEKENGEQSTGPVPTAERVNAGANGQATDTNHTAAAAPVTAAPTAQERMKRA